MLVQPPSAPDERHLRVRFGLSTGDRELRFVDQRMFGGLSVSEGGADLPPEIAHIARDPLDPEFDDDAFVRRAAHAHRRGQAAAARPGTGLRRRQHLRRRGACGGRGSTATARGTGSPPPRSALLLGEARIGDGRPRSARAGPPSTRSTSTSTASPATSTARCTPTAGRASRATGAGRRSGGSPSPTGRRTSVLAASRRRGHPGRRRPPDGGSSGLTRDSDGGTLEGSPDPRAHIHVSEGSSMAKALIGYMHSDPRMPARLVAENARLRARVAELEALTLQARAGERRARRRRGRRGASTSRATSSPRDPRPGAPASLTGSCVRSPPSPPPGCCSLPSAPPPPRRPRRR